MSTVLVYIVSNDLSDFAKLKMVDKKGLTMTSSVGNFWPKWFTWLNIGIKNLLKNLENRVKWKR